MKNTSQIQKLIKKEEKRQKTTLQMIPSENFTSNNVREAVGSILMNKYSEGYAGKRYYQGNKFVDEIENIAIENAKKLFKVPFVNVQPYSGSPANMAVYFALLEKNDVIMGLELPSGGHLTHGHPKVTFSGKYFKTIQYSVDKDTNLLDYEQIEKLALKFKPKIIVSGHSAYPRKIDFKKFGEIAEKIGAYHMADISHISGLIVGGMHQSPVKYANIVTTTTHKTLRGPRGALIMVTDAGLKKDPDLGKKINKAVFPGLQGGPHNNTTAGIAICLEEASTKEFKEYTKQIVANAKVLAKELKKYDFKLVTGGTENHLVLIDLRNKHIDGWCSSWALEFAGIIVNRNSIPYGTANPFYPSGIRLGTPALTTMGMKEQEMILISKWINEVIKIGCETLSKMEKPTDKVELNKDSREKFKNLVSRNKNISKIRGEVENLCRRFS